MTIITRSIPKATKGFTANPFKLFIPRELELEPARAIWEHLRQNESIVLADPFALPGVSTVFPGVFYDTTGDFSLTKLQNYLNELVAFEPEGDDVVIALQDAWVELWVPDALEDEAEALDVTDLSGKG